MRVTARRFQCTIAVAHAPHSGEALAARDAWWADLSRRLSGQPDLVLLVDANGRLGSSTSAAVGNGGFCQDEDSNGGLLHRSLLELGLCVPATFGPLDASAFTWVSNGGCVHRIDYVAVPSDWGYDSRQCARADVAPRRAIPLASDANLPEDFSHADGHSCDVQVVDSAGDWEDHSLVSLTAHFVVKLAPQSTRWRVGGVDRAALIDPVRCASFQEAVRSIPPVPWHVSVDEHERSAASAVCAAAKVAFGLPSRHPRKEYVDPPAWDLIRDRRTVKMWCRERRAPAASRGLRSPTTPTAAFVCEWAALRLDGLALGQRVFLELAMRASLISAGDCPLGGEEGLFDAFRFFLRHSGGVLKGHLKAACNAFLEVTAQELAAAQAADAHALAWHKLRSLAVRGGAKRKGARALPGRAGEDGVVATDAHGVSGIILHHFAGIEAAEVCSVEALADRHALSPPCLGLGRERDINNVCDLVTLRRLFARSKRGRACGMDGVSDDFLAIAPAELADVFHPLLTKCSLRVQEPLAHKCGIAVDLWKRKGDHLSMKWYRSLLLNSAVQKHHYRFLRGRLMTLLGAVFLDSQCGGFRGKGTGLASLGVRGFLAATRSYRISALALFVDLKSGFYTVVRELVVKLQTSGDDIGRILDSVSAPAVLEGALLKMMAEPAIVERYLGDSHLGALLSEAHTNTWFVVDGRRDVARAVKGSRPGCCLADFVFNVGFAPALEEVKLALAEAGYLWSPPVAPAVFSASEAGGPPSSDPGATPRPPLEDTSSDFTYADDSCFCCVLRSNVGVARSILAACVLVSDTLLARGMVVNWDRGKSAAVVAIRGALSRSARRDLFVEHKGQLALPGSPCVVHLERTYVHLGTEVCAGGSMGPAVSARVRAHAQAMAPLRRCVCPRKAVSSAAKLTFVDSLATSRLCHSIGAWDALTPGQVSRLQAALVSGYRQAMSMPHKDPTRGRRTSSEVFAATRRLGMGVRLSLARLRLLTSLLRSGPRSLLRLLDYLLERGSGWPSLLACDCALLDLHWGVPALPTPMPLAGWVQLARSDPAAWRSGVARVERRALASHVDECLRVTWRRSLDAMLTLGRLPLPEGNAREEAARNFLCYDCGAVLATPGAWRTHRAREHGYRHPARSFALGTVCNGCCVEFHSRPRLVWHMMHSKPACLAANAAFFAPGPEALVDELEATDRAAARALRRSGEYDRVAAIPHVRVPGCLLPSVGADEGVVDVPPVAPLGQGDGPAPPPLPPLQFIEPDIYYVLHFFSGQRRPGDYQDWLDQSLAVSPYPVWVISLDVAIDATLCDLSSDDAVGRWLNMARSGRVVMVLGGPPCETWSVARWNGGARVSDGAPRAVRSAERLWGLPDLNKVEIEQVALGNALLRTVVLFLTAARVYGFSAIMEHPQLPSWAPGAPSSWRLQELVSLSRAGGTADLHLDQCCCGTRWKKPTRLFAVGVPELARLISVLPGGGRCNRSLGHVHVSLSGKGNDGVWRTAPAKTYNSAMCKMLADATFGCIGRFLHRHAGVMAEERGLPADIEALHVPLDHYDPDSWLAWTHDCARAPH